MGTFGDLHRGAIPDGAGRFWLELHGVDVEFRQCDAVELVVVFTEIPCLLHQVFAAVVVMEQAGVKTDPVDANRLAPWPADVLGGDQIISAILECTIDHLDISVDQPEPAVRIAQIGSPDASRRGVSSHIKLAGPAQRAWKNVPMHQVLGLMQANAWEPFESGIGNVISVTDANH